MSREKQSKIIIALTLIIFIFSVAIISAETADDPMSWRQERHARFSEFQPSGEPAIPSLIQSQDILLTGTNTEDLLISESVSPANFVQDYASLIGLRGGRMVCTWEDNRFGLLSIALQLLDNSGNPIGSNTDLVRSDDYDLQSPVSCADTNGYFYVVWRESSGGHLQAARFDSLGSPVTDIFFISDTTVSGYTGDFDAVCMPDGELAVVWEQYTVINTIEFRVFDTD